MTMSVWLLTLLWNLLIYPPETTVFYLAWADQSSGFTPYSSSLLFLIHTLYNIILNYAFVTGSAFRFWFFVTWLFLIYKFTCFVILRILCDKGPLFKMLDLSIHVLAVHQPFTYVSIWLDTIYEFGINNQLSLSAVIIKGIRYKQRSIRFIEYKGLLNQ